MLDVLYEDNHLLAVNKQAMLPTMGVADERESLLSVAKDYIRKKYNKPGNVYLGIVSRLDAPVTGVVLLARTSKAAGRLSEQFRERDVEKLYWAVVEGHIEPRTGRLIDFLRKDERHRRMHIAGPNTLGAQQAELRYHVLGMDKETGRPADKEKQLDDQTPGLPSSLSPPLPVSLSSHLGPVSLLEVRPLTGRKHQIRVQLSHAGFPIVGDRKYGSQQPFLTGIALHSRRLVVRHPVSKMHIEIEAAPPRSWQRLLDGYA
jgi:23S rRNA pseudouridine1911/1915/1917 synthase